MDYVICSECHVTTSSAGLWSGTEECPSCGRHLPVWRRALAVSLAHEAALVADAAQEVRAA